MGDAARSSVVCVGDSGRLDLRADDRGWGLSQDDPAARSEIESQHLVRRVQNGNAILDVQAIRVFGYPPRGDAVVRLQRILIDRSGAKSQKTAPGKGKPPSLTDLEGVEEATSDTTYLNDAVIPQDRDPGAADRELLW